jgi:hypothetical protein
VDDVIEFSGYYRKLQKIRHAPWIRLAILSQTDHVSYEGFESLGRTNINRQLRLTDSGIPEPMSHPWGDINCLTQFRN